MAGSFSGNLLGSFSGRGADVSPMQFIQEMRQRAIQAEQQKKLQQQQMAQSFTMALMAKKQQEAEMAQQGQQFQQSQAQRVAERAQAGEQFRSEQERIREAARAQEELRRLGDARMREHDANVLENQRRDDERRSMADAARARDERNLVGVAGDVGQIGEKALANFGRGPDIASLEAEVAAAREEYDGRYRGIRYSATGPGPDPIKATSRLRDAEAALAAAKAAEAPDPLDVLDKAEAALRHHASSLPDAGAKAAYLAAVAKWKEKQEAEVLRRDARADYSEGRKDSKADKAKGRELQSFGAKVSSVKAANEPIEKQIAKLDEDARIYEQVAALEAGTPRAKNAENAANKLRDKIAELEKKLAPIPVMQ